MSRSRNLSVVVSLLLAFTTISTGTALAQDEKSAQQPRASAAAPTVTVSTSNERVRVASPDQAALRLEIYSDSGERLHDSGFRAGSLLDFRPADANAAISDGTHLLVVTTRDLQGRVRQRVGALKLEAGRVSVAQAAEERATPAQAKSLADARSAQGVKLSGPAASVTVLDGVATQAATLATHDGREGQLTSTAGALTLRTGDVLKGEDTERVRVTEEGRVGIGTDKPEAALDVAGEIRARGGIRFDDGSLLTSASDSAARPKSAAGDTATTSAAGTGTANRLAKWAETGGAGTLADSAISETAGNVVIDGSNLRLSTAPTTQRETNLVFLSNTNQSTGIVAGSVPSFTASNGPFFAMRGNAYTTYAGQRGLFAISAGNVASPVGNEGSVIFQTGAEQLRMIVRPDGNVGIGTATPAQRLDVAGNLRVSGAGNGLIFPDGSKQTTAVGGISGAGTAGTVPLWTGASTLGNSVVTQFGGNVGIGASAPTAKLEVVGGVGGGVSASSTGGFALHGSNPAGWAVGADGNARQSRDRGGWVKAMIYVDQTGAITRCFNSFEPDGGASLAGCGFTVSKAGDGVYTVSFPFAVNDRFYSLTAQAASTTEDPRLNMGANFDLDVNPNSLVISTFRIEEASTVTDDASFMLVIY